MEIASSPLLPLGSFAASTFSAFVALQSSQDTYRTFLLIPMIYFGIVSFNTISELTSNLSIQSGVGLFILIWLLHMICVVFEARPAEQTPSSIPSHLRAYKMLFNPRRLPYVNSETQSKDAVGAQPASPARSEDASKRQPDQRTPENINGFLRRAIRTVLLYAGHKVHMRFMEYAMIKSMQQIHTPLPVQTAYVRRIPSVTLPETGLRLLLVLDFVSSTYLVDNMFHSAFSIVFIDLLRLDNAEEWPPLFGSVVKTYSIRDFWGKFWHRLVSKTYLSLSKFILQTARVKPSSILGRHLTTFLIFFLSGVAHATMTWRLSLKCGWWQDLSWFVMNFAAIEAEEILRKVAYNVVGKDFLKSMPTLCRLVGYVWTWGFMFWSLPKVQYAKMHCGM